MLGNNESQKQQTESISWRQMSKLNRHVEGEKPQHIRTYEGKRNYFCCEQHYSNTIQHWSSLGQFFTCIWGKYRNIQRSRIKSEDEILTISYSRQCHTYYFIPFYRWGHQDSGRLKRLLKLTQLGRSRERTYSLFYTENSSAPFYTSGGGWLSVLIKGMRDYVLPQPLNRQSSQEANRRGLIGDLWELGDMYNMGESVTLE